MNEAPRDSSTPNPAILELHPERQAMLNAPDYTIIRGPDDARGVSGDVNGFRERKRRPKTSPYTRETGIAARRQAEIEARARARQERDMDRKAMGKARRPDKNGKMRLGKQSKVLLGRVQRLLAEKSI